MTPVEEIIKEIQEHGEVCGPIIRKDSPMSRQLGFMCLTCYHLWTIRLMDIKQDPPPDWLRAALGTKSRREELARRLNSKYLITWDERKGDRNDENKRTFESMVGRGEGKCVVSGSSLASCLHPNREEARTPDR